MRRVMVHQLVDTITVKTCCYIHSYHIMELSSDSIPGSETGSFARLYTCMDACAFESESCLPRTIPKSKGKYTCMAQK